MMLFLRILQGPKRGLSFIHIPKGIVGPVSSRDSTSPPRSGSHFLFIHCTSGVPRWLDVYTSYPLNMQLLVVRFRPAACTCHVQENEPSSDWATRGDIKCKRPRCCQPQLPKQWLFLSLQRVGIGGPRCCICSLAPHSLNPPTTTTTTHEACSRSSGERGLPLLFCSGECAVCLTR